MYGTRPLLLTVIEQNPLADVEALLAAGVQIKKEDLAIEIFPNTPAMAKKCLAWGFSISLHITIGAKTTQELLAPLTGPGPAPAAAPPPSLRH